jgi:hypothetical protein
VVQPVVVVPTAATAAVLELVVPPLPPLAGTGAVSTGAGAG